MKQVWFYCRVLASVCSTLLPASLANLNEYQYAAIGDSLRRFADEAYAEYLKTKKANKHLYTVRF